MQARLSAGGRDEICSGRDHFYGWHRGYQKGKLEQKILFEESFMIN